MCLIPVYLCKQVVNEPRLKRQGQPRASAWELGTGDCGQAMGAAFVSWEP